MGDKRLKKGLGAGLDALFGGDEEEIVRRDDSDILELPISKIEPREAQPRYSFDEVALNELSESLKIYGMIQPITVRSIGEGYYQIIAGERRWRAARQAGFEQVPVRVLEADERRVSEIALVENLQREDLNPIEEARGLNRLMEEYGLTQEEASKSIGKSRSTIANSLRLLNLEPFVMELLEDGMISTGHAKCLLGLQDGQLQETAANVIVAQGLSVRQTEKLCTKLLKDKESSKNVQSSTEIIVNYTKEIEKELEHVLGRKVKMSEGKKKGKIEIEFYDADDRESLIENLRKLGKL